VHVLILVKPTVPMRDLDSEDKQVPGTYRVELNDCVPTALIANAALDGFHESVPVGVLDYFEFSVHQFESGRVIDEDTAVESYEHGKGCKEIVKISDELDALCVRAARLSLAMSPSM
jgi:hypothetical protein